MPKILLLLVLAKVGVAYKYYNTEPNLIAAQKRINKFKGKIQKSKEFWHDKSL